MSGYRCYQLTRSRTLARLARLEPSAISTTLYLAADLAPAARRAFLLPALPAEDAPGIETISLSSSTGAAVFLTEGGRPGLLVQPPFPLGETYAVPGMDTEPLRTMLETPRLIGLVLVRLGNYAIGICRGEEIISSKTGTGLVHSRHRKGGQSQRRFERRRQEQAHQFLARVATHVQRLLGPVAAELDHVVLGGSRQAIRQLRQLCPLLQRFDDRLLPPRLDIPPPRHATLQNVITDVWSSTIYQWTEGEAV